MKILMLLLLISTTLLAQNTESTKNWDKTFDIKNLSTYFKENKLNIMLVHSGDYEEEAKLAHISFMKSIKNLKNIKNIISNKDLNNIKNKKDSELISEAEDLHSSLDYYLIIRVYPDQNGDFVLVLSQYNKNSK